MRRAVDGDTFPLPCWGSFFRRDGPHALDRSWDRSSRLAINGGSVALGAKLLSAYSAGLAIPFLAAALGIGWVTTILRKYNKVMHYVEIAMGAVLVIVGVMLFAGIFELIARYGYYVNFGL